MIVRLCILIISLGFSLNVNAKTLCEKQQLGWHFYCDNKKDQQEQSEIQSTPIQSLEQAKSELKSIQEKLEDLRIMAVMNPSEQNLKNYIKFQQEQLERAEKFSKIWQASLWQTPELDYNVSNPISTIGNELLHEVKSQDIKTLLNNLNQRYGVFFFYSSQCIYCKKFAPIMKLFADSYGISVVPISMDGGILTEWPETIIDNGQSENFGMSGKPVPAVILYDNQTKQLIPIGFGLLTLSELEERIYLLTRNDGALK